MGGLLYISGDPTMTPCNPPETQSYYYASLFASYGVMLALWQRETRGIGAWIDASIQASMALHEHVAFNYSAEGRVMKRAGSQHQHNAPANLFQCKNGWIALFVTQTHWPLLLKLWDDHDPALDDPKWINSNLRRQHADYINAQVTSFTSRFLKEDLAEMMQKNGIPGLPVNSPSDFMKDPHIQARGILQRRQPSGARHFSATGQLLHGQRQPHRRIARAAFRAAQSRRSSVASSVWREKRAGGIGGGESHLKKLKMENGELRMADAEKHGQPIWLVVIFNFQFSIFNY